MTTSRTAGLDPDEFADRVGLALSARTSAELGSALADLPWRPNVPPAPVSSGTTQATSARVRNGVWLIGGGAFSLLAGFGAVAAAVNYRWPLAYLLMVIATVTGLIAGHQGSRTRSRQEAPVVHADDPDITFDAYTSAQLTGLHRR